MSAPGIFKNAMTMTEANIENSHGYQAEQAKISFQSNITSLLELKGHLAGKATKAKENGKKGFFIPLHEAVILDDWLKTISGDLMADYVLINRVNRLLNLNNEVKSRLLSGKSPNLKDLLKP